ncbi:hypothetical protein GCM10017567_02100 [Amycolatopsis bullii]|uniref:Uncharacterized protein n=1 Tax=Amycolatopsis bullii TaxID=941987 RepID=A0ABQ3JZ81_9PSEU|nr:hypothetical protein GCM10017567_02100 [Amycolatopsis bullii]
MTPPLMLPSPALNCPDPVGMSPFQFAWAFETGMRPPEIVIDVGAESISIERRAPKQWRLPPFG